MDDIRALAFRIICLTLHQPLNSATRQRELRAEDAMNIPQGDGNLPGSWPALETLLGTSITDNWRGR